MERVLLPLVLRQYGGPPLGQLSSPLIAAAGLAAVLLVGLMWGLKRVFNAAQTRYGSLLPKRVGRRAPYLIFLATAAVYLLVAVVIVRQLPLTGDEPHFLMTAHSLCVDGDINLADNFDRKDYLEFYPYEGLAPHAFDYKGDGTLVSIHAKGLPLLVLPTYCLFRSVLAVRVLLALLSAFVATQVFLLAYEATWDMRVAMIVWAVVSFTSPMLTFSSQVYPEMAAALGVVWGFRRILAGLPGRYDALGLAAAVGFLPWLHIKYTLLSLVLILAGAFILRNRKSLLLPLILPPMVSGGLFLFYCNQWYGSFWPTHRYSVASGYWSFRPQYAYYCFIGGLVDREFGLIPFSPTFLLSAWGLGILFARRQYSLYIVGFAILVHLISLSPFGCEIGYSLPARYFTVIVPLLSVPLALFLKHIAGGRWLFGCLAFASLCISVTMLSNLQLAYMNYDGMTRVPIAMHAGYMFPTVRTVPSVLGPRGIDTSLQWSAWKPTLWLLVMIGGSLAAAIDGMAEK
jgi:hypothetical protein